MMGSTMENKSKECHDMITFNLQPMLAYECGFAVFASSFAMRLRDRGIPESARNH